MNAKLAAALNGTAEVIGEARTVTVINGVIMDNFSDETVTHIYKITGGAAASGL